MAELSFRNISKSYGDTEVVAGFSLEVTGIQSRLQFVESGAVAL